MIRKSRRWVEGSGLLSNQGEKVYTFFFHKGSFKEKKY